MSTKFTVQQITTISDSLRSITEAAYPCGSLKVAIDEAGQYIADHGAPRHGTVKGWLKGHDGESVFTVQIRPERGLPSLWVPGLRTATVGPTYAEFNGSRRYFKGLRVAYYTSDMVVASDADCSEVIVYMAGDDA